MVLDLDFPVPGPQFRYMEKSSLDIILNISFHVPQKKECHADLEQQEVVVFNLFSAL